MSKLTALDVVARTQAAVSQNLRSPTGFANQVKSELATLLEQLDQPDPAASTHALNKTFTGVPNSRETLWKKNDDSVGQYTAVIRLPRDAGEDLDGLVKATNEALKEQQFEVFAVSRSSTGAVELQVGNSQLNSLLWELNEGAAPWNFSFETASPMAMFGSPDETANPKISKFLARSLTDAIETALTAHPGRPHLEIQLGLPGITEYTKSLKIPDEFKKLSYGYKNDLRPEIMAGLGVALDQLLQSGHYNIRYQVATNQTGGQPFVGLRLAFSRPGTERRYLIDHDTSDMLCQATVSNNAYSKHAWDEAQSGHYRILENANGMQPGSSHTARERRSNPIPAVENPASLYRDYRNR